MKSILIITVCLSSIFLGISSVAADVNKQGSTSEAISENYDTPPIITEQERKKLEEDAKKLSEDFRALFKDLSGVSQKVIKSVIDYIADWVETNYAQLSEEKKEKLKQFLEKLKEDYSELKDVSVETLRKFLEDFQSLLDQLEQEEPQQVEKPDEESTHI